MAKIEKISSPNKWQIKNINNLHVLHHFENPVQCVHRMPVMLPHPSISGQAVINSPVCASNCPMFDLKENGLFNQLEFKCANGHKIDVYMHHDLPDQKTTTLF